MRFILNLMKLMSASSTLASPFTYQKKFSFCLCDARRCLATRRQTQFPSASSHYFNLFSFISSCSFSLLTSSLAYSLILAAYDTSLKISLTQFLSLLGEYEGRRFYSFSSSLGWHIWSIFILNLLSLKYSLPLFLRYSSCSCRCSASVICTIASSVYPNSARILYFIGDFYFCRCSYYLADLSGRWEMEMVGYSGMHPRGLMMTLLKEETRVVGIVANWLGLQTQWGYYRYALQSPSALLGFLPCSACSYLLDLCLEEALESNLGSSGECFKILVDKERARLSLGGRSASMGVLRQSRLANQLCRFILLYNNCSYGNASIPGAIWLSDSDPNKWPSSVFLLYDMVNINQAFLVFAFPFFACFSYFTWAFLPSLGLFSLGFTAAASVRPTSSHPTNISSKTPTPIIFLFFQMGSTISCLELRSWDETMVISFFESTLVGPRVLCLMVQGMISTFRGSSALRLLLCSYYLTSCSICSQIQSQDCESLIRSGSGAQRVFLPYSASKFSGSSFNACSTVGQISSSADLTYLSVLSTCKSTTELFSTIQLGASGFFSPKASSRIPFQTFPASPSGRSLMKATTFSSRS